MKTRPRTNLNGGNLVRSTFLVLTFTFTLTFLATFVLALIFAFLSPFGGSIFAFLGCNDEKRSILSLGGGIPFGAFGWTFARAYYGLRRRFAFDWSLLKAGIDCARKGSRGGRSPVEEDGSVSGGPGCMPIGAGVRACQRGKEKRRRLKTRPRTNLNGGDLVRSTFLVLTFTFTLTFMATPCPCPYFCLSFPLWGQHLYLSGVQR